MAFSTGLYTAGSVSANMTNIKNVGAEQRGKFQEGTGEIGTGIREGSSEFFKGYADGDGRTGTMVGQNKSNKAAPEGTSNPPAPTAAPTTSTYQPPVGGTVGSQVNHLNDEGVLGK